ncbi:Fe-S oxidoreductase [Erysipelotrichaceae bacterium]|nr:Fe-S oxidoreductase [Erysipelotrichaceae bacterium]
MSKIPRKINQITSNPFSLSFDHHRYHTWNYHLQEHFGSKVFKVSLNAGFTCPNIDGKVAIGGCTFCSVKGSGDFAGNPAEDLKRQFETIKTNMHKKWPDVTQYIAYFQAFSNTYAPLHILKEKFEAILEIPGVVGLAIATRPDCLPDDIVEYLAELNKRTYLWVELGLQSMHDSTGRKINRGHDLAIFEAGFMKLKAHNIQTCVHIINGLPGETTEMMQQSAQYVADIGADSIKIHLLHILKNTAMAKLYDNNNLALMDKDIYCNLVASQLEVLPQNCIIQRLTGDGGIDDLIGPLWSLKKFDVMNTIDKVLLARDSYQGKYYNQQRQIMLEGAK